MCVLWWIVYYAQCTHEDDQLTRGRHMEHLRFSFSTENDLCAVMVYIASTYTIQYKQCVFQSSCWMLVGSLVVTYVDCTHHIGWTRAPPEFQAVDLPNFAPSTRAHSAHLVIHTHIHSARRCIHQMWLLHAQHLCSIINWKKKRFLYTNIVLDIIIMYHLQLASVFATFPVVCNRDGAECW